MHLVVAVLRPAQLERVRQALAAIHVTRLTICDAQGYAAVGERIVQESVVEIAVNDDFLERTVDTIRRAIEPADAATTPAADARRHAAERVFVLPIQEAVQIYRDVRGPEAV